MSALTAKDIIKSIGWLDGGLTGDVDFDEADWRDEPFIHLTGRHDGKEVGATFQLVDFEKSDWPIDDEDDEA